MRIFSFILLIILMLASCTGGSRTSEKGHTDGVPTSHSNNYGSRQEESSNEQEYGEYALPEIETPSYMYGDAEEEMSEEERYFAQFSNFEPDYNDRKGIVVYEGQGDYYIIETSGGYVIAERYSGILYEDQTIYGPLHSYGSKFFIDLNRDSEVKLYIEDYMLTQERAVEWMGEHHHLKYYDQTRYDEANSDW